MSVRLDFLASLSSINGAILVIMTNSTENSFAIRLPMPGRKDHGNDDTNCPGPYDFGGDKLDCPRIGTRDRARTQLRGGDGVIDRIQTIATVTNCNGSKTETLTNRTGAAVLIDTTVTTTSADGKTITVSRDATGDGLNDQTETRVTAADGSTSIVISDLKPDASLQGKATTTTSANGLTRTVALDLDGNATNDVTEVDATVVNGDGSRTKTVAKTNQNGSLRDKSVTTTSADGRSKSTQTDLNGDTVTDLTYACLIAVLADGSSTSTETTTNNNGSLRAKTVTSLSADGLSRTTQSDVTGDNVFDLTTADVTVVNGDGSRTQTVSTTNADGSLWERMITLKGADGRSRRGVASMSRSRLAEESQLSDCAGSINQGKSSKEITSCMSPTFGGKPRGHRISGIAATSKSSLTSSNRTHSAMSPLRVSITRSPHQATALRLPSSSSSANPWNLPLRGNDTVTTA